MQKVTIATIVFLIVFSSILVFVHASEPIELGGDRFATRTMNLVNGDSVTGTITCIKNEHNSTKPVSFYIYDPDRNTIATYDDTLGTSFSFVATKDGTYTLSFSNPSYSDTTRFTLDYAINNPLPAFFSGNTPYIIIAIVASCLAVIFAFLAFKRNKKPPPPPVATPPPTKLARTLGDALAPEKTPKTTFPTWQPPKQGAKPPLTMQIIDIRKGQRSN